MDKPSSQSHSSKYLSRATYSDVTSGTSSQTDRQNMWCVLVRTVYFVKCSNRRIKNESNKNWIDSVYKEILWGTQKQKYKETNQVNRHSQEEPVGAISVCFLSIFSNPTHQTRATFRTAQHVLTLPFKSESLRTKGTLAGKGGQGTVSPKSVILMFLLFFFESNEEPDESTETFRLGHSRKGWYGSWDLWGLHPR